MYYYETHLHTSPVSKCARASVAENVAFYHSLGYDGIFITNHFLDGNIGIDADRPYEEKIRFFFSDIEEAIRVGHTLGIKVFPGNEISYKGTDFLIYGLDMEWYLSHPEILDMKKTQELALMKEAGALIVQAHPYREANYIDHIRLFPRSVEGVEVYNACRTDFENELAVAYAKAYQLLPFAGSDNHRAKGLMKLGGMCSETPIFSVDEFISLYRAGELTCFRAARQTPEEQKPISKIASLMFYTI